MKVNALIKLGHHRLFQWDKFLFVANATLKFNMKLKDDAKLPSGRADAKLILPFDSGSKMKTRTNNAASSFFIPSDMKFFTIDVTGLTPVASTGGGGKSFSP